MARAVLAAYGDIDDDSAAPAAGSESRSRGRNGPKSPAVEEKPLTAYQQRKAAAARRGKAGSADAGGGGGGGGGRGDSELARVAQMLREGKM